MIPVHCDGLIPVDLDRLLAMDGSFSVPLDDLAQIPLRMKIQFLRPRRVLEAEFIGCRS
jgi:hypothetical protein